MSDLEKEKLEFIKRHSSEIKPITKDPETLKTIDAAADFKGISGDIDPIRVEQMLEEFETKIFVSEKSEFEQGSKRVLIEASDPGSYNAVKPLISILEKDERCRGITAMTSGLATRYIQRDFPNLFSQIRGKGKFVLIDLLNTLEEMPIDIVLATTSSKNAPDSVALFGSKSNLRVKKLFLVLDSWIHTSGRGWAENKNSIDELDGVFCNDWLAKKIFIAKFSGIPANRVYSFGTPVLDSLDTGRADEYRKTFREKLGIDETAKVLTYLGCIDSGLNLNFNSRADIDEKTFQDVLRQVVRLADENPDTNFIFAFRPHPRDPLKERKYGFVSEFDLPSNLSFKDADSALLSNDVAYGSDVIFSIVSTENFLAPLRGRSSIFLGFDGQGMGKELLNKILGMEAVEVLAKESAGISVADSPEDFKKKLMAILNADDKSKILNQGSDSAQRILDIVLAP